MLPFLRVDPDRGHARAHNSLATWKQQGQNPTETLPKTITLK